MVLGGPPRVIKIGRSSVARMRYVHNSRMMEFSLQRNHWSELPKYTHVGSDFKGKKSHGECGVKKRKVP